jgi:glycyl-tRNA synthetase
MTQIDTIIALCKQRGFIFPGSEIYGGLANTWDYGPLGVELLNNIKKTWWREFVQRRNDVIGMDSGILLNSKVWEASGHVGGFSDPLVDCKECHERFRPDKLIEDQKDENVSGMELKKIHDYLVTHKIKCPSCKKSNWTDVRTFNLMFETNQGVSKDGSTLVYLRPETAQGIFINFKSVQSTSRKKVPFGIAQIGKAFRNEVTPGNFIFRTREFEQMELEFFCKPGSELEWFQHFKDFCWDFLIGKIGLDASHIRFRDHESDELAHYANACADVEYHFPFGQNGHWGELWGIASRTDFDLKQHEKFSGEDMKYLDPETNEKYIPYVIEPSLGVNRLALAVLLDAYSESFAPTADGKEEARVVLKLHKNLAPYKAAVLPLHNKLNGDALKLWDELSKHFMVDFDTTGSIGKRYRRQDEIGTPYCITFDFDTLEDKAVTVRDRDTMEQERVKIDQLGGYLWEKLAN